MIPLILTMAENYWILFTWQMFRTEAEVVHTGWRLFFEFLWDGTQKPSKKHQHDFEQIRKLTKN